MNDIERRLRDLGDRTAGEVTYREAPRRRIVRRARLRRAGVVAAPVAAVVLFAAVAYPRLGSDVDRGVPVSVDLAAAAEATEDAGSARIEMSMTMEFDGRTVTSEISGEIDFDDHRSHFRMTGMGAFNSVDEMEIISIGSVTYQRGAGAAKWVKSRVDAPEEAGLWGGGADGLFSYLESVSDEVTSLGEEVVDGVPVTHLRATIDPSKVPEAAWQSGMRLDPIDVWIDDAQLVRKMAYAVTIEGPDASSSGSTSVTMLFSDFGVPVDVEAPAPDDVTDEPPETWGGPGGDLTGGESSLEEPSEELDEFGVGELFTVTGADELSGPHAVVTITEGRVAICIQGELPFATSRSSIVEIAANEPIVAVPGDPEESNPYDRGGCAQTHLSQEITDSLRSHPELFELRFERAKAPDVVVPLTQTF